MPWLLANLALQNLGRRKARTLLLVAAVAVGSGALFAGATLMSSIERSMAVGFTRMGADLMVVPDGALTNITAALLTVEPTDLVLEADLLDKARLASVLNAVAVGVPPNPIPNFNRSGIAQRHNVTQPVRFAKRPQYPQIAVVNAIGFGQRSSGIPKPARSAIE